MILWTLLLCNIFTRDELTKQYYELESDYQIVNEQPVEMLLDNLIKYGIVASGTDYVGVDALYDLFKNLYIVPLVHFTKLNRIWQFGKLMLQGVPYKVARNSIPKLSSCQKKILSMTTHVSISAAELIACFNKGITKLTGDDMVLNTLYNDDVTTCDNIGTLTRFYPEQLPVIQELANLYLQRSIIFDRFGGTAA